MQTYIHEIGHAIGLGHAGNYNGSAVYGVDNLFTNDSWQASVMSYFSQDENTDVDADFAYLLTPMIADVIAIRELYGTAAIHTGDDIYSYREHFEKFYAAMTIVDTAGQDTLDFNWSGRRQRIDLREGEYSNIDGTIGNLGISRGTQIENAIGGRGVDTLLGNDADNILHGRLGRDVLAGNGGADTFVFDTALNARKNVDRISDFTTDVDRISLENLVFGKVGLDGVLSETAFHLSSRGVAHDRDDRIIYETDTGEIYYDSNGNKKGEAVLFAVIEKNLALDSADFLVV